jgi:hypothetical protein
MKLIYILSLFLIAQASFAQVKVIKLSKGTVPASIQYIGKAIDAIRFTDSDGEHIVIITETGETQSKSMDNGNYRDAALYAYHYTIAGNKPNLTWHVHDFVKECPVDISANYVPNTFSVTDLNKDGKAEVWLMYKKVCHGDVSPSEMKIIMYEGSKKYAVRGTNRVKVSAKKYEGGAYTFDDALKKGATVFRAYAVDLWKKNLLETWK